MTQGEKSSSTGAGNHLAGEKSPYLRQHAKNPVDWYPWGDEAFDRARELNRPVFLSIGYATCHWCHVMARESFEDEAIAGILNTSFVPVKVDREERPDIDSVYMAACQAMTGQGGWPLTILMTPDKQPFFAGTYLPPHSRAGMTGLDQVLRKAADLWKTDPGTLEQAAGELVSMLAGAQPVSGESCVSSSLPDAGYRSLAQNFDRTYGGFGRAPKFPAPTTLLFLLRYGYRTGSQDALFMAERTLDALRCGGIHDHVGGGFHRYATDRQWMVPHFEKMLYDQALLLMAFTEAWQVTGRPAYRTTAESIVTYVTRDLLSAEGAFFSAEDADSPGGEGAFYVWTRQEFLDALGTGDGDFAAGWFGVTRAGNFPPSGDGEGRSVLSLYQRDSAGPEDEARAERVRSILRAARNRRPRPRCDTKILADWNCMMIAALAQASRALGEPSWYTIAHRAMTFIHAGLRLPDGGLAHRYCDGEAAIPAFADDYAWAIQALCELYSTGQDPGLLDQAVAFCALADTHLTAPAGEYYAVPDTAEPLILRRIEIHDGATPSANAVMLGNLCMLSGMTGDPAYERRAERLAGALCGAVQQHPSASCAILVGIDTLLHPGHGIVLAGTKGDPLLAGMLEEVWHHYLPDAAVHVRDSGQKAAALDRLAPFTSAMTARDGRAAAYICRGHTCYPPVHSARELADLLKKDWDDIRGS